MRKCIKCNIGQAEHDKRPYCKPCRNRYEREHYDSIKDRDRQYKKRYGVGLDWYNKQYQLQEGKCAICFSFEEILCIDHEHINNQVRELLCHGCNIIVGRLEHPLANKALEYINYHKLNQDKQHYHKKGK